MWSAVISGALCGPRCASLPRLTTPSTSSESPGTTRSHWCCPLWVPGGRIRNHTILCIIIHIPSRHPRSFTPTPDKMPLRVFVAWRPVLSS
ncbi:hypothetical protein EV401DRAFT_1992824 [Pisolithus croceorrhizus]|nr:hypothetical protein EV401DRAFT_1992824 [Pisolithus croceorrhizus]